MKIKIEPHTLERTEERGANEADIKEVIGSGTPIEAKYGRKGKEGKMNISYNPGTDLLYIRIDEREQEVVNQRVSNEMVLDIGEGNKIVGIEILDASKNVDLDKVLPVKYNLEKAG